MSGKYDMLNRKSRVYTAKHPPIPNAARAAQFAPFAALTGYEDTVRETARRTDSQILLADGAAAELDRRLQKLREHQKEYPEVEFTWFVPDEKKSGGAYRKRVGVVKKFDMCTGKIWLTDETEIPIEALYDLEGELFLKEELP